MPLKQNCTLTAREVADEIGGSPSGIEKLTVQAMAKLKRNPRYRRLWLEHGQERRSNNVGTVAKDEL
jgi:hypothetical protein